MKISIITVSYNSDATIEDTIVSVSKQTYQNIEYIIIDGSSKDNTLKIINKYPNVITKIISEKDKGIYDAMNKGIAAATGDVIGFVNSDDLFCDKDALKKVIKKFQENDVDSVYADIFYVKKENTDQIERRWVSGNQKSFLTGWHPAHPTFYVKRKIYEKYGSFDLNFKLAADFEIMLRFLDKFKISTIYLAEPLIKMRLGGATNKNFNNIYIQNKECIAAFKKNGFAVNSVIYPIKRLLPKIAQYIKK